MERIDRLRNHISAASAAQERAGGDAAGVFLSAREASLPARVYESVLTPDAVAFIAAVASAFADDVREMHDQRKARRLVAERAPAAFPRFDEATRWIRDDPNWTVDALPQALLDRRVDIGDVSPADRSFLLHALNSGAQGVQVDFDDGHCPTWKNTLLGHANIMDAVRGSIQCGSETLRRDREPALLLVRPRAWNMDEMNMVVGGQVVPGAIFDFALHLFHNGQRLLESGRGPFLYLPKLEGYKEAALWCKIFEYTESNLHLPSGCIKAIVLIENIFAAFEMDEILYELRHHSIGLNCGMWDYTASIVVNFRTNKQCVLPDRQRYVSMKSPFLQHYMEFLIRTCKRSNAPATTGMVPFVLDQLPPSLSRAEAIAKAKAGKGFEALAGSDGALVYDLKLVAPVQEVFADSAQHARPILEKSDSVNELFYRNALMALPEGRVTLDSVRLNLTVALSYMLAWFKGRGTVVVNGCVEDSATAEISRAQLWQWIHHAVVLSPLEDAVGSSTVSRVNARLVHDMLLDIAREVLAQEAAPPMRHVVAAINLVFRVITMRTPPSFMTTFLLEQEPLTKSLE